MELISPWVVGTISCSQCGEERNFELSGMNRYFDPKKDLSLPLRSSVVWCNSCNTVRLAELLEPLSDEFRPADQRRMERLLMERTTPPRCLSCGGTDHREIEGERLEDGIEVGMHAICNTPLRIVGLCQFTQLFGEEEKYDFEGRRIS